MKKQIQFLCHAAIIAALYAVLTFATWQFSSMGIQVRLAEALCILPAFTPAAIPGLFVGCLLSNLIGGNIYDILFGSLATLLAALLTRRIGKAMHKRRTKAYLLPLPAIFINALAVPLILYYGYGIKSFLGFNNALPVLAMSALSVFIGQSISCAAVGIPMYFALEKINDQYKLFK